MKLSMLEDGTSLIDEKLALGETVEVDIYTGTYYKTKGVRITEKLDKKTYETSYLLTKY